MKYLLDLMQDLRASLHSARTTWQLLRYARGPYQPDDARDLWIDASL